eukprot:TRINITY_DN177_c0_g1_i1.p2 TRINITY_DN177_c0_g1~~TRINITY_DN177_c0_g1_i1.p2  ORF type:complete len:118 (+),score=14.06 TRINITY_DN177_c0_g1_i1:187-540(+)
MNIRVFLLLACIFVAAIAQDSCISRIYKGEATCLEGGECCWLAFVRQPVCTSFQRLSADAAKYLGRPSTKDTVCADTKEVYAKMGYKLPDNVLCACQVNYCPIFLPPRYMYCRNDRF